MIRQAIFSAPLLSVALLVLSGCGAAAPPSSTTPSPTAAPSALSGNWLIYGAVPAAVTGLSTAPGLVMTFDVIGSNIVASATLQGTCSSGSIFGETLGAVLSGTVANDGTFTVSPLVPIGLGETLTVHGTVPSTSGASWAGTYSLTSSNTSCVLNNSGNFTATSIPNLSGTFSASGSGLSGNSSSVSMSATLQQYAPLYEGGKATGASSELGLSGSIQISGFSCFSKGTVSTATPSEVEGSRVFANFTMDDGSTLMMLGSLGNLQATQVLVPLLEVRGGSCSGLYASYTNPLVLQR